MNGSVCRKCQRLFFGTIVATTLLSSIELFAQAPPRKFLPGDMPSIVAGLTPIGNLPATNRLNLAVGLPVRNQASLDEFLRQVYDPGSTNYHKYLTPQEYAERFGSTEADYRSVIQFAETNGFTVTATSGNRVVLDVEGSVSNIERAFQIKLHIYRHPAEDRDFFAPDAEPSVPVNLPVADVSGLSDFSRPHPALRLEKKVF